MARTIGSGRKDRQLMSGTRRNIQYSLALEPRGRGEALGSGSGGTEPLVAKPGPESPTLAEQLMEEVCDRENLDRAWNVARQSKQVTQRQSAIHPMVEQCLAGKLMSSPKPPAAGARRVRLYTSLTAGHHNCRMQLTLDEAHQRQ